MDNNAVLIHPAYFPSIAQMAIIAQADTVVFEADDNYQKQTYRNRTYISQTQGVLLLNVPILHTKGVRKKHKEVQVENAFPWQSHHWKSLQSAYRTSPYFEYYEDEIVHLFKEPVSSLFDHNINIHKVICDLIGIENSIKFTEEYFKDPKDVLDLRKSIDVKTDLGITYPPYIQVFSDKNGFFSNLSILDLLFTEGPNSLTYLEQLDLSQFY